VLRVVVDTGPVEEGREDPGAGAVAGAGRADLLKVAVEGAGRPEEGPVQPEKVAIKACVGTKITIFGKDLFCTVVRGVQRRGCLQ